MPAPVVVLPLAAMAVVALPRKMISSLPVLWEYGEPPVAATLERTCK
jgi:hypothetical protein